MNEWLMQYKYLSLSKTAAFRIYTYNSAYACTHKGKHKLCRHGKAFGCLRKQCRPSRASSGAQKRMEARICAAVSPGRVLFEGIPATTMSAPCQ